MPKLAGVLPTRRSRALNKVAVIKFLSASFFSSLYLYRRALGGAISVIIKLRGVSYSGELVPLLTQAVEINVFLANLTLISAVHSKNSPNFEMTFPEKHVWGMKIAEMHKKRVNNKRRRMHPVKNRMNCWIKVQKFTARLLMIYTLLKYLVRITENHWSK